MGNQPLNQTQYQAAIESIKDHRGVLFVTPYYYDTAGKKMALTQYFNVKLKNENTLECSLTGDYWKATSLSNETINYVSKSDDYLSLVVGLKLYF